MNAAVQATVQATVQAQWDGLAYGTTGDRHDDVNGLHSKMALDIRSNDLCVPLQLAAEGVIVCRQQAVCVRRQRGDRPLRRSQLTTIGSPSGRPHDPSELPAWKATPPDQLTRNPEYSARTSASFSPLIERTTAIRSPSSKESPAVSTKSLPAAGVAASVRQEGRRSAWRGRRRAH